MIGEKLRWHCSAIGARIKPNILFIMGDDIGWMQPSIYHRGLMVGETPNAIRPVHASPLTSARRSVGVKDGH